MEVSDRLIPMDAEAIREWRRNIPEGHSRADRLEYAVKGPGRRGDPDQTPEPMDPERGFDLEPLEKGIREPLETMSEMERRVLHWVRNARTPEEKRRIREVVQQRVALLKQTSPLQFSHIDSLSLEEQMIATLKAKAQAATERVYRRRGWAGQQNFDLIRTARPATGGKVLLPGQMGRDT